jgi:RNA 3'-terminal phosphate cyclase (ATP)
MIAIDGGQGEGGGQVLRSSLALSMATGQPFRIERIRAARAKPGLLRQHLTAVNAAAAISQAEVDGAALGSQQLTFRPGVVRPGDYHFAVGTAGSAMLVLQAVLPPLLTAAAPSQLVLEGGTHNPAAPPFDFLQRSFLPLLRRMGARVEMQIERVGFYPAGGGRVHVRIEPTAALQPLSLLERGAVLATRARALITGVPRHVADRELRVVTRRLGWNDGALAVEEVESSPGPGNALLLEIECEQITEICASFGEIGLRAEGVAERAVHDARRYLAAGVPVGRHLADQLLVPMALAGGGALRTLALTRHATTNAAIVRTFLPIAIETTTTSRDDVRIELQRR